MGSRARVGSMKLPDRTARSFQMGSTFHRCPYIHFIDVRIKTNRESQSEAKGNFWAILSENLIFEDTVERNEAGQSQHASEKMQV